MHIFWKSTLFARRTLFIELFVCYALSVLATRFSTWLQLAGGIWGEISYGVVLIAFLVLPIVFVRKFRQSTEEQSGLVVDLRFKDVLKGLAVLLALWVPVWVGAYFWNVYVRGAAFHFAWSNYAQLDGNLLLIVLTQLVLVAFPEEYFYRGYLQSGFDKFFGSSRKGRVGSILLTSLLFGLGHVFSSLSFARMNVFFPSLLFGWLRNRSKGLGGCIVLHAGCNLMIQLFFVHFQF